MVTWMMRTTRRTCRYMMCLDPPSLRELHQHIFRNRLKKPQHRCPVQGLASLPLGALTLRAT
ncbi:hypothetical protein E2562_013629 [Oryza meyeriana var. granulata]|uniref:Uncharacterized protein n=1 Tax=Oryza meyeriana var. granulata TaxID=110450 RepID=A0A6G1F7Z5_9ORYZ|nr:hypothetical protein E2562_013629 [Oryza meyeriana var. granulata]